MEWATGQASVNTRTPSHVMQRQPKARLKLTRRLIRRLAYQTILVTGLLAGLLFLAANVVANLRARSIGFSFGFLEDPASFDIGESIISFQPGDTIGRAFLAGLANTLLVGFLAIILATLLGTLVGIMRMSSHPLFSNTAKAYVECLRNTPLLMQLLLWHTLLTRSIPAPRQAWHLLDSIFITNRGVFIPSLSTGWPAIGLAITGLLALSTLLVRKQRKTATRWAPLTLLACLCIAASIWLSHEGLTVQWPIATRFDIRGGLDISPEFIAVMMSLGLYSSAFIVEIIRGGVLSVPGGQREAAQVLGLKPRPILWLVIFPQALRIIRPAMTNQYVTLVKNSSLAVAIGYPDIVRVQTIAISQTGHAIECCCIIIAVYLSISLTVSMGMTINGRSHLKVAI